MHGYMSQPVVLQVVTKYCLGVYLLQIFANNNAYRMKQQNTYIASSLMIPYVAFVIRKLIYPPSAIQYVGLIGKMYNYMCLRCENWMPFLCHCQSLLLSTFMQICKIVLQYHIKYITKPTCVYINEATKGISTLFQCYTQSYFVNIVWQILSHATSQFVFEMESSY